MTSITLHYNKYASSNSVCCSKYAVPPNVTARWGPAYEMNVSRTFGSNHPCVLNQRLELVTLTNLEIVQHCEIILGIAKITMLFPILDSYKHLEDQYGWYCWMNGHVISTLRTNIVDIAEWTATAAISTSPWCREASLQTGWNETSHWAAQM